MAQTDNARLTFLISAETKKHLEDLCARQDLTASQVLRRLISDYLDECGANVTSTPSGSTTSSSG
jgi:hypothetical protein